VGIGVEEKSKSGYFVGPQLSDGFLVFLAQCALFNLPDQPRIFFVEEPETYLNPNKLRVIYGLIHRFCAANPDKQVLMSSHSPYFIDWSDENPDELTLMKNNNGWVEFQNLRHVKTLRDFLEYDEWGREWVSSFFRADYADEPLQCQLRAKRSRPDESKDKPWDIENEEEQILYADKK
jgi:ABC-type multidrug transport system ATPase subunit